MKAFSPLIAFSCILISSCAPTSSSGSTAATCKNINENEKYFVITPVAGLGNRLRAMASSEIMARASNRKLIVDWIIEPKEMPAQFNQLFENKIPTYDASNLPKECTIQHIKSKTTDDNVMRVRSNFDGTFVNQLVPMNEIATPIIWTEPWLEFKPKENVLSEADYNDQFRQFMVNLMPIESIRNAVDTFRQSNNLLQKRVVGVHFRSWSMEHEVVEKDLGPYDKFVEEMKKELAANKDTVFYLATDDVEVAKKFKKDFPDRIFHREDNVNRITVAGQQSAVVEWVLLGHTEYIIGTYQSSFSDTASLRTKEKKKVALGPGMKHIVRW